jgi:lipopolysaccharide export LptBFGC system permease protein LptF
MILSFLFFAFLFYVLFKLVFNFVIPIYKTTRKVRQSFRDMQQKMQEEQPGAYQPSPNGTKTAHKEPLGDYIDFEEVKE